MKESDSQKSSKLEGSDPDAEALDPFVQVYVKVVGRVQGVGFRIFVFDEAKRLGLWGWVKNCADGSVEGIYQGHQSNVLQMIAKTKQGPSLSRVESVEVSPQAVASRFLKFSIVS